MTEPTTRETLCERCAQWKASPLPLTLDEWTCPDCGTVWPKTRGQPPKRWVKGKLAVAMMGLRSGPNCLKEVAAAAVRPEVRSALIELASDEWATVSLGRPFTYTPCGTWILLGLGVSTLAILGMLALFGFETVVLGDSGANAIVTLMILGIAGFGVIFFAPAILRLWSGDPLGICGAAKLLSMLTDPPELSQLTPLAQHYALSNLGSDLVGARLEEVLHMLGPEELRKLDRGGRKALLALLVPGNLYKVHGKARWTLVQAAVALMEHSSLAEALPALDALSAREWRPAGGPASLRAEAARAANAIRKRLADAKDVSKLLRASGAPDTEVSELLRRAQQDEVPPEELLRSRGSQD